MLIQVDLHDEFEKDQDKTVNSIDSLRIKSWCFIFQAEDGIRDIGVTGVQTCALPIYVAVIEGVMGLYDGASGKSDYASTAHVAKILDAPIVLVVDASKGARSIAAIILGFLHFDRNVRIKALILNKVAGERHAKYITDALAGAVKVPVIGILSRNSQIQMQERHLGLVPALELKGAKNQTISGTARYIAQSKIGRAHV